jgi:hypothetical protein
MRQGSFVETGEAAHLYLPSDSINLSGAGR